MIEELGKGKYRFRISQGSGSGRRVFTKTVVCGGKREAKKLYQEFEEEVLHKPQASITIDELLKSHIDLTKSLGRKASTLRGYNICYERFTDDFKGLKAKEVTEYHVEKQIALMAKNGLSAKTIKNTIALLSASYEHAIHIRLLEDNPCKHVTLPKGKSREVRILHQDEIQLFLFGISDAPLDDKVAYELALFMGLRRSEILGLKEADVDILKNMLHVHNTRHRVDGEDILQDTKTERSTRSLAMPELVALDIARLLESHRQFPYEKSDFLIQDGFGNPIQPQALASRLSRLEDKKGLPKVSLHGLRHTYASLLNEAGVDIARISAELGHANITTTANIYTHIFKTPSQSSRGIASVVDEFSTEPKKLSTGKK